MRVFILGALALMAGGAEAATVIVPPSTGGNEAVVEQSVRYSVAAGTLQADDGSFFPKDIGPSFTWWTGGGYSDFAYAFDTIEAGGPFTGHYLQGLKQYAEYGFSVSTDVTTMTAMGRFYGTSGTRDFSFDVGGGIDTVIYNGVTFTAPSHDAYFGIGIGYVPVPASAPLLGLCLMSLMAAARMRQGARKLE